eukprot:UN06068
MILFVLLCFSMVRLHHFFKWVRQFLYNVHLPHLHVNRWLNVQHHVFMQNIKLQHLLIYHLQHVHSQ